MGFKCTFLKKHISKQTAITTLGHNISQFACHPFQEVCYCFPSKVISSQQCLLGQNRLWLKTYQSIEEAYDWLLTGKQSVQEWGQLHPDGEMTQEVHCLQLEIHLP